MRTTIDDQLRDYTGLVESIALELSRSHRAAQVGAEYDDLFQEGLIAVWKKLTVGIPTVGADHIRDRMRDYMKWLGRTSPIDYNELLPLNDETAAP